MKKKNFVQAISACILIAFAVYAYVDREKRRESIERFQYSTVGKITEINSGKGYTNASYDYFYNGEKYRSSTDIEYDENHIGKYYRVDISEENPKYSRMFTDQEIKDSASIVKAGFKYEDR